MEPCLKPRMKVVKFLRQSIPTIVDKDVGQHAILAMSEIGARRVNNRRLGNGSRGNGRIRRDRVNGGKPVPDADSRPSHAALLKIVNKIFRTHCQDIDAIDATPAWEVIVEEIQPYSDVVPLLALQFETGMTFKEAARKHGMPLELASSRFLRAIDKLRHPCRIMRIRNSIMGWPNLYRDV